RLEQQVFGRIAGDRHLGKRQDVDAELPGVPDAGRDALGIAVEVPDRDVQLSEPETKLSHGRAIGTGARTARKSLADYKRKRPVTDRAIPFAADDEVLRLKRALRPRALVPALPASHPTRLGGPHG